MCLSFYQLKSRPSWISEHIPSHPAPSLGLIFRLYKIVVFVLIVIQNIFTQVFLPFSYSIQILLGRSTHSKSKKKKKNLPLVFPNLDAFGFTFLKKKIIYIYSWVYRKVRSRILVLFVYFFVFVLSYKMSCSPIHFSPLPLPGWAPLPSTLHVSSLLRNRVWGLGYLKPEDSR